MGDKLGDKLGDTSMKIIAAIKNDKEISIAQLASQLAISTTTVEKQLAKLKKKGILLRHGTKDGYWEISKESKE
ncbi:winged helix-turn-helix transcriptional regulator [Flavobacterium sp. ZS1P14]|uniref:winged helix-turn-helix transcriptional regulator n=1 Tax=Flavobacterium sp. ZS1P14 TaxID=3401729 RepID=UPI003AACBFF1